jgi:hypothetical protein
MARIGLLTATIKQGCLLAFMAIFLICMASCGGTKQSSVPATPQVVQVDFSAGAQNWVAGFADYPAGQETFLSNRFLLPWTRQKQVSSSTALITAMTCSCS